MNSNNISTNNIESEYCFSYEIDEKLLASLKIWVGVVICIVGIIGLVCNFLSLFVLSR